VVASFRRSGRCARRIGLRAPVARDHEGGMDRAEGMPAPERREAGSCLERDVNGETALKDEPCPMGSGASAGVPHGE